MAAPLLVAQELRQALEERQLHFVHWKSNLRLASGLSGDTDLDVLVEPSHAARFRDAVGSMGGVRIVSQPWARYPAVEDWIMFDEGSGKLLHLHVHLALVTGLKRVKHLRLPWVNAMFRHVRRDPATDWPIPEAELELLTLLVRIWAKMPLWRRLVSTAIPPHVVAEVRWLEGVVRQDALAALASELDMRLPIPLDLSNEDAIIRQARAIHDQMRKHFRMTWPMALWRAGYLNLRLHATRWWLRHAGLVRYRKILAGRGLMIAVIGSDGSGKSTLTRSLEDWLAYKLDVHAIYMGSGDGRAGFVNGVRKRLSALIGPLKPARRRRKAELSGGRTPFREKLYRLLDLLLLRRKVKMLRRGRRLADGGSIILLDRYPQSQFNAISDGPRQQDGRGFRWAAGYEMRLFGEIAQLGPDLILRLRIDPETAHARKPDHDLSAIRTKCAVVDALNFPNRKIVSIDASVPPEMVVLAARQIIWEAIRQGEIA